MAKVADIEVTWVPSVSADIAAVKVVVSKNGSETELNFGPEVRSYTGEYQALTTAVVTITVTDSDGLTATDSHTFSVGDLENPQPVTSISHRIVAVRDVPDVEPTPVS